MSDRNKRYNKTNILSFALQDERVQLTEARQTGQFRRNGYSLFVSPDETVHEKTGKRRRRRLTSKSPIIVPDNFDLVHWVTETPEDGARVAGLKTQKGMRKMFLIQVVLRPGVKPCSFEAEYRWAWIEAEEPNLAGFETIRVSPENLKQILTLIQAFIRECDLRNRHASRVENVRTPL